MAIVQGVEQEVGSVTLFEQCPICGFPVNVLIYAKASSENVDVSNMDIGQAMNAVNNLTCDVEVSALVVNHDCRTTRPVDPSQG